MSGWEDSSDIPQQSQNQSRQNNSRSNNTNTGSNNPNIDNNQYKGSNQNRNQYNNSNQNSYQNNKQQQPTKVVYVEKNGPRRFQFFNSNKEKSQTEEKPVVEIEQVEEKKENEVVVQPKQPDQPLTMPTVKTQIAAMVNPNCNAPHKILLRAKEGIFNTSCYVQSMQGEEKILTGCADFMILSKDEQHLIVTQDTLVKVIKMSDHSIVSQREFISVKHTSLSKQNKFMQVYDRIDNNKYTAYVFSFPDFKLVKEFNEKRYIKENAPYVKLNMDETKGYYYNYVTGFVEVYSVDDFSKTIHAAEMQNIDFFQISPKQEFIVGCFLEHMVGYEKTQAKLQFYNLEKDKRERVKNVDKAQEINLKWSPDGNHVIIITQTIHDATGNTYYGQTALWLYSFGTKKLQQIPTIEGPVHDVDWNPNGENFIAIVGYMPAKPVLYTLRCEPLFSFGTMHRNTIRFQPQGRLVLFGGFGNISGDVDIWELNSLEKLAKFNAATSASIEWSVDGKYILSGVLTPRLRVDNNFKLFKWNGELLNSCNFSHTELYEVIWKNNQAYSDTSIISEKDIAEELNKQRHLTKLEKKTQKPKFGGGNFADLLRNDKAEDGPKKITGNEEWLIKAKNEAKKTANK